MLPSELLAAGGLSLIIYVGGDVLRRMLKQSPARHGSEVCDIVVSDNYLQGVHLDVDIDHHNESACDKLKVLRRRARGSFIELVLVLTSPATRGHHLREH